MEANRTNDRQIPLSTKIATAKRKGETHNSSRSFLLFVRHASFTFFLAQHTTPHHTTPHIINHNPHI